MRDIKEYSQDDTRQCKVKERSLPVASRRLQNIYGERYPCRPDEPGEKDKAHRAPPHHEGVRLTEPHPDVALHQLLNPGPEIGRASRRERVGQYGSIPGVA